MAQSRASSRAASDDADDDGGRDERDEAPTSRRRPLERLAVPREGDALDSRDTLPPPRDATRAHVLDAASMALQATTYHLQIALSDVDRGVYEALDLRLARHPSESLRYMLTRTLAYALSYEEGIAFSKGGLSASDEPPVNIHDPTGVFLAWIDVGAPSAERLHRASKAARRVALFTHVEAAILRREAATRAIHRVADIEVTRIPATFLDALEALVDRNTKLDLTRNDGQLYVTVGTKQLETTLESLRLVSDP
jgi:uncharacterized protein YaeQ